MAAAAPAMRTTPVPDASGLSGREVTLAWVATGACCLYYLFLITNGGFDLGAPEALGFVFDRMAWHLLHGRFDIEPEIIGREAFVFEGKTYAYFGIFPALLRVPLVLAYGTEPPSLSRLSCWVGLCIAAAASTAILLSVADRLPRFGWRGALLGLVLCATLLTGPMLGLAFSAYIFNEPIIWSVALAMLLLLMLVRQATGHALPTPGRLAAMGVLAGLALLTRPVAGIGMTFALMVATLVLPTLTPDAAPGAWRRWLAGAVHTGCWIALGLVPLVLLVMAVNYGRWGNPFEFSPQTANVQVIADARRMRVNLEYGVFELARLPVGLGYYLLGLINDGWLGGLSDRIMDDLGWPRSALAATVTAQFVLAAIAAVALLRGTLPAPLRGRRLLMLAAMPLAMAAMLLTLSVMNYRYRLEFLPLLVLGSALGFAAMAQVREATARRAMLGLGVLVAANLAVSHLDLLQAKLATFAQPEAARQVIIEGTAPFSRLFVRGPAAQ
ncbi:hypothetical protein [Falsiroseomonas oryzae]|uniref:hypothetical protein n=1 Tax=Falsiroseomonas oryzae TaxID=2766473 RepID=UPI0022EA5A82|nr:hypothetical protein [Roseomonas sp. MO-31]